MVLWRKNTFEVIWGFGSVVLGQCCFEVERCSSQVWEKLR